MMMVEEELAKERRELIEEIISFLGGAIEVEAYTSVSTSLFLAEFLARYAKIMCVLCVGGEACDGDD